VAFETVLFVPPVVAAFEAPRDSLPTKFALGGCRLQAPIDIGLTTPKDAVEVRHARLSLSAGPHGVHVICAIVNDAWAQIVLAVGRAGLRVDGRIAVALPLAAWFAKLSRNFRIVRMNRCVARDKAIKRCHGDEEK
jgi:hypothetical protein